MDEVLLNRREDTERLKNLSTALTYKVEAKGKDRYEVPFYTKFVLCSNNERNIAATVSYVLSPKKRAEILLSKGIFSLDGVENIAREFEMQSALRPDAQTKLLHIPMSFHVRDRDLMECDGEAIVREWLRRMEAYGFRFDQYIVVRHHDQDHKNPHFHLVINLTLVDGHAVKTSYIGKYAKMASVEVTRNWAIVTVDSRTQRTEQENVQPMMMQSANPASARLTTFYTMDNAPSSDVPTDTDGIEADLPSGIGGAMMELLIQPAVVHAAGGGGGSKEDDDEKKNKLKNKRFRR